MLLQHVRIHRRFQAKVSAALLRAIGKAIIDAIPAEVAECMKQYPKSLRPSVIGSHRYHKIQAVLSALPDLQKAFPLVRCTLQRHVGGNTYYSVVEDPSFRLHAIKVDGPSSRPAFRQRRNARPLQPSFFDVQDRVYATLIYGFGDDPAVVSFMYILLLDESGAYIDEPINLLGLIRETAIQVEVESQPASIELPLRGGKKIRRNIKAVDQQ